MAYGLKYYSEFDSTVNERYRFEIHQLDYTGSDSAVTLAGAPIKHAWQTDEPKAAIKGSSLVANLVVGLGESADFGATIELDFVDQGIFYESIILISGTAFVPEVGVPFTVSGHVDPLVNGVYTPLSYTQTGANAYSVIFAVGADQPTSVSDAATITGVYNLSVTAFYSTNDQEFKGRLYWNSQLLFEGFLVQDDSIELMVDYAHEITLSFNDNLGLLKDVPLDDNIPAFGGYPAGAYFDLVAPTPENFIYLYNTNFVPAVAVAFTITGHIEAAANATWTPTAVTQLGNGNYKVQVADLSFIDMQAWPVIITGSATIDLYDRNTLLNIIRVCLYNTGLELNTHIFANIFEERHDVDRSFLEQTYIDTQTFISGETFMNCYDVLAKILERFNLTLFQSKGVWNIVRWDELRYNDQIPSFVYDSNLAYVSAGVLDTYVSTGYQQPTYPELGLTRGITRPYQFVKETFNYQQPKYLLKNFDLQDLGALITSYVDGSTTVYEYEMTGWHPSSAGSQPDFFIRVITDTLTGDELERFAVVEGPGDTATSVVGTPFEVTAGDVIEVNYTFRTTKSQAGPTTVQLGVRLYNGTTTNYADDDPTVNWKTGLGWNFQVPSGGNTNVNQSVTINPGQIPFDGLIYIYIPQATLVGATSTDETHIKDIRVTYTPFINDSTKIIGHTHLYNHQTTIKNNEDVEISLDDSPRNSIAGTLFYTIFTSLIQSRTRNWYRLTTPSEERRIGDITTFEQLFWRREPRTKLEGTFYGMVQNVGESQTFNGTFSFYMLTGPNRYNIDAPSIPAGTITAGAILTVTGTVDNNGTFTVIRVVGAGEPFPVGSYMVEEIVITEPGVSATIDVNSIVHISMLTVLKNVAFSTLNFVFGSLEIDYRENSFSCTQWEIFEDGEVDDDLLDALPANSVTYAYNYLYDSN